MATTMSAPTPKAPVTAVATATPEAAAEIARQEAIRNARYEQLLSEKLMDGYVLMEATCPNPNCSLPLVKNNKAVPKSLSIDNDDLKRTNSNIDQPVVLPAESFEQPFQPVNGVPVCVGCNSHVITQEIELAILEESDALKNRGSVYVALQAQQEQQEAETPDPSHETEPRTQDQRLLEPEIIHLEDVTEQDLVGTHRQKSKFVVDIASTSFDMDGISNVEMSVSPRVGTDPTKPIIIEEEEEPPEAEEIIDAEEELEDEKSVRREIATKVLGAKMLQGWTLKEKTCAKCAMPIMEHKGKDDCPVCPALAKRAKKKLKKQQKIAAEKARLQADIQSKKDAAKAQLELQEKVQEFEEMQTVRDEIEVRAIQEEEEATQRAEERKRAIEEEKARILAASGEPAVTTEDATEEPASIDDDEETKRERAREEKVEMKRLKAIAKEEEERRKMKAGLMEKEAHLAEERAKKKALRDAAAKKLTEETATIEGMDESSDDKTVATKKDQLVEERRKLMAEKITLDEEVAKLEEERNTEAMEARRLEEERRLESESRMIAALEADAAVKALAAEEAIRNAKAALKEVSETKKQIITQTIEMAEKEALAETEESLKAKFEEHSEPVILQTKSEIKMERWETLRLESRAIMTRRVLQGWNITSEACTGKECYASPLIEKNGVKECTVCGGCGNGTDGVYTIDDEAPVEAASKAMPAAQPAPMVEAPAAPAPMVVAPFQNDGDIAWLGTDQEENFEANREKYVKEIGNKLLQGWTLLDASCETCIVPLMMDEKGNTDICISCGKPETKIHNVPQFDASTIATKEMATLEDATTVKAATSDDSDLVSTIKKHAQNQQPRRIPVETADPPAFKPTTVKADLGKKAVAKKDVIPLPHKVDFADAAAIRELVDKQQGRDDTAVEQSITNVANLFLKSAHGNDFEDFGRNMDTEEVKELVEIFLVASVDANATESFKVAVAEHVIAKMKTSREQALPVASPESIDNMRQRPSRFQFDDEATKPKARGRPFPEGSPRRRPPKSPGPRRVHVVGGPSPTSSGFGRMRSPRDDGSVISRSSTVASEAIESIYDRIDQCKKKLLDPNNSLDEQIATAALLEKLAQAAVAVREMEVYE